MRGIFRSLRLLLPLFVGLYYASAVSAQSNPTVLVVYNQGDSSSQSLATYYAAARNIPSANLCPIAVSNLTSISYAEYTTLSPLPSTQPVRTQIRNCLNSLGSAGILYIVMIYNTPFALVINNSAYALDSFVADIWDKYTTQVFSPAPYGIPSAVHGYYADYQSQGDVFSPFVTFAAWRSQPRSSLIYSVWRLDGATAALAQGLVDKAISAEQHGLTGYGCFDLLAGNPDIGDFPDSGYYSTDWDLHRAAGFVGSAGFPILEDFNSTEFGTPPSPNCPNAALYSGWYSLDNYNDAFTWNTGAIGFHLDSNSAVNPRSGNNWSANAIQKGITVTAGSVNEPYTAGLSRPAGVYLDLLEGARAGDAFLRNTRWLKWQILFLGDPLYTPFAGGLSPFNPPSSVTSLALSPTELVGGSFTATATLVLSAPAAPGGLNVALSTDIPSILSMPASITVPAGKSTATFTITPFTVTQSLSAIIRANTGSLTIANTLVVDPLLAVVGVSSSSVKGGTPVTGEVGLNDRAPLGGVTVSLTSANPAVVSVPASIVIPAGQALNTFPVSTSTVGSSTSVNISALYAGVTVQVTLTVTP